MKGVDDGVPRRTTVVAMSVSYLHSEGVVAWVEARKRLTYGSGRT